MASKTVKLLESARVSTASTLCQVKDSKGGVTYAWRTDLTKTRPFWEDWFKGLSKAFLDVKIPKHLILAGSDRLDKELIIGHMQGRFKLDIIPHVGHVIQEDNPKKLAQTLVNFLVAFKIHEDASHVEPPVTFKQMS